jgi:predicted dehydrogenase
MATGTPRATDAVIVGAGLMGRWHAHEIVRAGGRVVAVVDPDLERARQLAGRSGVAVAAELTELDGLLDRDGGAVGARAVVHVCTPSGTHEPLIEHALRSGRHVLVEKPMAGDATITERLLTLARQGERLLAPVHQFPFQPGVRRLLDPGQRGLNRLGETLHLMGEARSAGAEGRSDEDRERIALEILPHFLSLTRLFVHGGLDGIEWTVSRPRAGELSVAGEAEGVAIHLLISMSGRPPANLWTVIGSRATGRADLFHGHAVIEPGGTSRAWKVARPFAVAGVGLAGAAGNLLGRAARRQPAYPGLRELIAAFHAAAAMDGENPIPPEETMEVARAMERISAQR